MKFLLVALVTLLSTACTFKKAELGTADNPIKLFFTPSVDAKVINSNSKEMREILERETGYKFAVEVPQSYIAVVEAFGSKKVDVAALNTYGYLLANKKYGVEARLMVMRFGLATYQAQILARAKDSFKSLKDLEGKKFAYVDSASLSGFVLPSRLFKDAGVKLGETVFAMKHDNVVSMIYQGQVDAGATFYSPPADGKIQDARRLVKSQYPDVEDKIKIVTLTEEVPNDPIAFRKDMPEEMKQKIVDAFVKMVADPEGKAAFEKVYSVTDVKIAADKDYDGVRKLVADANLNVETLVK